MSLIELQTLVVARLTSHAYFAGTAYDPARPITVLAEDAHDINAKVEQIIGSFGALVLVKQPGLKPEDGFKTINGEISLQIRVAEQVTLNRDTENAQGSLQPCADIALTVARRIHGWKPSTAWDWIKVTNMPPEEDPKFQIYTVLATTGRVYLPL